jgi:outer membrane biosynthesis protein TonB
MAPADPKKRKLTLAEKEVERALKLQEKEEKEKLKAEAKAKKDEEKRRKDEERDVARKAREEKQRQKDAIKHEKEAEKERKMAEAQKKEKVRVVASLQSGRRANPCNRHRCELVHSSGALLRLPLLLPVRMSSLMQSEAGDHQLPRLSWNRLWMRAR